MNIEISAASLLPVCVSLVGICSFAWALRGHFVTVARIPQGMRLLSAASLLSYIVFVGRLFCHRHEVPAATVAGLVGFIASIILFWWTVAETRSHRLYLAHTDADPDRVNVRGPYAVVRHPFYLSYIVFWISTALIAGSWQWLISLILTLWYVHLARGEERRFRSSGLSRAYDAYSRQTGMLLPRLRRPRRVPGGLAEYRNDRVDLAHSLRPPPSPSRSSK